MLVISWILEDVAAGDARGRSTMTIVQRISMMISDDRSRYSRCWASFPYPPWRRLPHDARTTESIVSRFQRWCTDLNV